MDLEKTIEGVQEGELPSQEPEPESSQSDEIIGPPQSEPVLPEESEEDNSTTTEQTQEAA